MPTLVYSHVATLARPVGCPSLAVRDDGTALLVGEGIQAFKPGSPVVDLVPHGEDVPVEAGVSVRGNILVTYGGHDEGDEHGARSSVRRYDATTGALLGSSFGSLPNGGRRGVCAVSHGNKDVLFGGIDESGHPVSDILIAAPSRPVRALRGTMPTSAGYLQAGRLGNRVWLVGSGAQDWQPPKTAYDILASHEGDTNTVALVPALQGKAQIGVCAIQGSGVFWTFGGADGNGGVSAELWRHEAAGSTSLGEVVDASGAPYRVCYAAGLYAASENAIYLMGGTEGSPFSSTAKATDRIVRVAL